MLKACSRYSSFPYICVLSLYLTTFALHFVTFCTKVCSFSTSELYFIHVHTECPNGRYGHNCKDHCSEHCLLMGVCDRMTGNCVGGCQAGWKNKKCDLGRLFLTFLLEMSPTD